MSKQIFVNLPVKDLNQTIKFFTQLGFRFNPQFADEHATCMIIAEHIFVMLLEEKFFSGFIPGRAVSDTSKSTEVIMGVTAENRGEVEEMINKVRAAGGKTYGEAYDHGWMYGQSFQDLDGHIWEIFHMDNDKMPEEMKKKKN